jgi:hypothetical protein
MWATCPHSASFGYHAKFHEGCCQMHTNPLNCGASSSDISGYKAHFHGHSIFGEWQGSSIACELMRHGMEGKRHGRVCISLNRVSDFKFKTLVQHLKRGKQLQFRLYKKLDKNYRGNLTWINVIVK